MKFKRTFKNQAGFTMTELMVSISIMVFVLAIVLVNYRKFDSSIVLTNLAYDIGLSVREAQTYGISVKGTNQTTDPNAFKYPYGIHFEGGASGNKKSYIIFADMNDNGDGTLGNKKYDGTSEKVQAYYLKGNYVIKQLCATINGSRTCGHSSLDITFKRPNPDASIYVDGTTFGEVAEIEVYSAQDTGSVKKIVVRATGQISIQNAN